MSSSDAESALDASPDDLCLGVCLAAPALEPANLACVVAKVSGACGERFARPRVSIDELDDGLPFDVAAPEESLTRLGIGRDGTVVLQERLSGTVFVYVQGASEVGGHCPESNWVSVTFRGRDDETVAMAAACFEGLVSQLPCFYGHARAHEDFEAQNMERTPDLTQALGRNLRRYLPGVYWLNYLGPAYQQLLPTQLERELDVTPVRGGLLVQCDAWPFEWAQASGVSARQRIRRALGEDLFFDRRSAGRATRAPTFSP